MTVSVSQQAYADLVEEAQHNGEIIHHQNGSERIYRLPKCFGRGVDRITELRNGLIIHIRQAQLRQPLRLEQQHESSFPLTAKFYLSSCSRVTTPSSLSINNDYEESHGYNYLYCLPNVLEYEEWRAEEQIQLVMIYADINYFRLFNSDYESLPEILRQMIKVGEPTQFHQCLGKNTMAMEQVLQQILHCPYQGIIRQMYLEAKALELLILQFTNWTETPHQSAAAKLRKDDIERLDAAKDILMRTMNNPPTLLELARQVGLNERKLKQGFRQVFGTTVFGYLQDYRLQQAQQLLKKRDMSIARVATTIGYTNPEAFSVAFRRKFAVGPKAYQMSKNY
ncbi:helix-turn-helix transcriptional regulator [Anabaena cylindrica FACHB-243]|uniref:Transcriptional regulator, AraC family n=1 Tax=Anabaena cylindrica (strain ATCC 27899 / PCC 7122) TaxID=272123 RepID=K9ZQF6_ANACC|nr:MULTISPECIES: AraC family transcriptional regulator [Anabaena]AFZ60762.1 transcriptional regulator, AraC family [Anabaena cylindrica PCC 7122]MBD2419803.1 helix-turn-helix transcriptional regulator [Anabaena cylindrica FACHB-243]MBY5281336.1 helix-turn-helix transcriptional regulator [Anabaena sp. CCAP 1446/1C]MBY5309015.1 helix-turn-helix transcriptional regulator [Anabaena sp. CCAP 1446/1C]MCM2406762.1 AraC family transcriptional regulator [Anabaena sp. CCAP 1446/1C]